MWEIDDIGYLKEAKEAVSKEYWELVSRKMVELGCKKKIPGVACERKWRELDTSNTENNGGNATLEGSVAIKSGSPHIGVMQGCEEGGQSGMGSPPATRSPSRQGSVSAQSAPPQQQQTLAPASSVPLPSVMVQQLAQAPIGLGLVEVQIKRELGMVVETAE